MAVPPRAQGRLAPVIALPWVRKGLIGLATFLALVLIASINYLPRRQDLRPGMIAPQDIEAPRTVEYVDEAATAAQRRLAMSRVQPVYQEDREATAAARQAVVRAFDTILKVRSAPGLTDAQRRVRLRAEVGLPLSQVTIVVALSLDPPALQQAQEVAVEVVEQVMATGVRREVLDEARQQVRQSLQLSGLQGRALTVASEIAQGAVRPNRKVDLRSTQSFRREAAEAVPPVLARILRGEVIVRKGDRIAELHMAKLAALGLIETRSGWDLIAGGALIIALLLGVTAFYLFQYQPEIWRRDRYLLLWSLVVAMTALLARIIVSSHYNLNLIPAAVGTILLAVLLRPRLALFTAAILAVLVGLIAGSDLKAAFVAFVGATVGVYAIRRISHRTDLVIAGLKVAGATVLAVVAGGFLERRPFYPTILTDAAFGVGNGVLVGIIAIGVLPYLENLFGLVTPIKLLELSNPGHPLLRRLQMEAPGTYHHSIIVGNLAEAAAEAIGADALLVRVGTYYHDIGKIRRPVFFVENQVGVDNPHERMAPSLSALTVAAHVRDGTELAREYGLPKVVSDFIPEHHGTSLITYFYHQAVQRGDQPEPGAYRYEGPKPQSRETALVMLADSVEAAVRSLPRPTPDRIYEVVRKIIHERMEDGQLDDSDLTFRDLERIAQAFTRILTGIFHPRIEYPDLERDLRTRRRERERAARVR